MDPPLSTKQQGRLVRAVAAQIHVDPFSPEFAALVPAPRRLAPQTPPEALELAVGAQAEMPTRTAA